MKKGDTRLQGALLYLALVLALEVVATAQKLEEVASAAGYFSCLKPRKLITVIESNEVPKTYVAGWVFSSVNDKVKELIGSRIIEMPKHLERETRAANSLRRSRWEALRKAKR